MDIDSFIYTYSNSEISVKDLANRYGIGRDRANKILKENNIPIGWERKKIIQEEKLKKSLDLYKLNKSVTKTAKELKIGTKALTDYLKKNNIEIVNYQNTTTTFSDMFSKIDNCEKAYWLGFLYADGSITKRDKKDTSYRVELCLKESDLCHIKKFKKFLNSENNILYKTSKLGNSFRIIIGCKKLSEDLISLGCVPNKSLILKFPDYDKVPKIFMNDFIRGYIDGDGYIGKHNAKKMDTSQ